MCGQVRAMPVYNYWVGVFTQSRMGNEDVEACDE